MWTNTTGSNVSKCSQNDQNAHHKLKYEHIKNIEYSRKKHKCHQLDTATDGFDMKSIASGLKVTHIKQSLKTSLKTQT